LQNTAKKVFETSVDEALYKKHLKKMLYLAQRLILLGDQYRLGERLVDAIEMAEYQQSEKEKIQSVCENHKKVLTSSKENVGKDPR
jgi:hypothetical protein